MQHCTKQCNMYISLYKIQKQYHWANHYAYVVHFPKWPITDIKCKAHRGQCDRAQWRKARYTLPAELFVHLLTFTEQQSTKSCLFSHWALIAIDNSLPLDPVPTTIPVYQFCTTTIHYYSRLSVFHHCFTLTRPLSIPPS